jgi:rhamnose transport system ATP-binding protein
VELFRRSRRVPGDVRLSVKDLHKEGIFEGITFDVRAGEVLGFAGLVGARRTDVGLALFGVEPADRGEVLLDGQAVNVRSPQEATRMGIAYTTEDRRQLGLVFPLSITANISLPSMSKYLGRLGLIKRDEERATAEQFRKRLSIRAPSVDTPASSLSGGNQQKVVLSKWLETRPRVLILDEPTRGIDVGAKVEVHQLVDELAADGMAIIIISSDLPEVLAMSDRILVMREGRQMAIVPHAEATQEGILALAMGQSRDVVEAAPDVDRAAGAAAAAALEALISGDAVQAPDAALGPDAATPPGPGD